MAAAAVAMVAAVVVAERAAAVAPLTLAAVAMVATVAVAVVGGGLKARSSRRWCKWRSCALMARWTCLTLCR